MSSRRGHGLAVMSLAVLAVAPAAAWPSGPGPAPRCPAGGRIEEGAPGRAPTLCVIDDHARREGGFVVVDARVANFSTRPITHAQVSVELYAESGRLLAGENTILRPDRLEPGQRGSVLVIGLYRDGIDRIRYRIAWQQAGRQHRGTTEHTLALAASPAGDAAVTRAGARAATRAGRARDPAWPKPRS